MITSTINNTPVNFVEHEGRLLVVAGQDANQEQVGSIKIEKKSGILTTTIMVNGNPVEVNRSSLSKLAFHLERTSGSKSSSIFHLSAQAKAERIAELARNELSAFKNADKDFQFLTDADLTIEDVTENNVDAILRSNIKTRDGEINVLRKSAGQNVINTTKKVSSVLNNKYNQLKVENAIAAFREEFAETDIEGLFSEKASLGYLAVEAVVDATKAAVSLPFSFLGSVATILSGIGSQLESDFS